MLVSFFFNFQIFLHILFTHWQLKSKTAQQHNDGLAPLRFLADYFSHSRSDFTTRLDPLTNWASTRDFTEIKYYLMLLHETQKLNWARCIDIFWSRVKRSTIWSRFSAAGFFFSSSFATANFAVSLFSLSLSCFRCTRKALWAFSRLTLSKPKQRQLTTQHKRSGRLRRASRRWLLHSFLPYSD